MEKLVVIDYSEVFFTSVFAHRRMVQAGATLSLEYLVLRKIFSYIRPYADRKVYLVADGVASWRKDVYPEYKGQRKAQRDSYEDLDWTDIFARYTQLLSYLDIYTNIYTFRDDKLEADDLIAILAKEGHDMVAFSSDKDLNQLCIYNNFTLISPKAKKVKNKFVVKPVTNPVKELEKLVKGGDKADNIPPAKTPAQRIINNKLVNLLQLPEEIEQRAKAILNQKRIKAQNIQAFYDLYSYSFIPKELQALTVV